MSDVDKRGRLGEGHFACTVTKDKRVLLYYRGRLVTTLNGKDATKFSAALERCESELCEQLLMAKATGHFKHGNERRSPDEDQTSP